MVKITSLDLGGLSADLAREVGLHDALTIELSGPVQGQAADQTMPALASGSAASMVGRGS